VSDQPQGAKDETAVDETAVSQAEGDTTLIEEPTPEAERDLYRDLAQRIQADFENYKKRVEKLEQERVARAAESLVTKLLPVLDTLDLALAHDANEALAQVQSALIDALSKEGLERVPSVDQAFDPNEHEAVAHEAGEGEHRVAEEFRAGYRWKGRVIRPAMVKVTGS
jgi:molecular chaperone GrpE